MFAGNIKIKNLCILSYTRISSIDMYSLSGCDSLEKISIPQSISKIGWYPFGGLYSIPYLKSLKEVTVEAGNLTCIPEGFDDTIQEIVDYPPVITSFYWGQPSLRPKITIVRALYPPTIYDVISAFRGSGKIYVPDNSVDVYKTADAWKSIADRIFPLSELHRRY